MGIFDVILEVIRAIAAWLRYQYDPDMIKRRDEINLELMKGKNREEVDQIFAGKNTVSLGYFLSESLRILRAQKTNSSAGGETSFSDRILPKPRDPKDRDSDPEAGF